MKFCIEYVNSWIEDIYLSNTDVYAIGGRYILTCIYTGGPATNVTWTRNGGPVTGITEIVLVDREIPQYEITLTVTMKGTYGCYVTNDERDSSDEIFLRGNN